MTTWTRYFVVGGKCNDTGGGDVADIVKNIAERISAPFSSVDVQIDRSHW